MKRELFDIWEETEPDGAVIFPFRVQLVNYVGRFPTLGRAESFVATTKRLREQAEKSVVNAAPSRKSK